MRKPPVCTNWTPVLTNLFDGNGGFNVTNPIDPASSAKFLLIKQSWMGTQM